jgi:hypothetical protein
MQGAVQVARGTPGIVGRELAFSMRRMGREGGAKGPIEVISIACSKESSVLRQ